MRAILLTFTLISTAAFAQSRDAELAAGAEKLARLHRQADGLAHEDPRGAAKLLLRGLAIELPPGPEALELRADLHARRAELFLRFAPARALQAADDGLREFDGRAPTPARALLELRRAAALEALGRDAEAIAGYAEAIAIARSLMRGKNTEETP